VDKAGRSRSRAPTSPLSVQQRNCPEGVPQFGLVAEESGKANPALVLPDKKGKPYSVRYEAVNAMLPIELATCRAYGRGAESERGD